VDSDAPRRDADADASGLRRLPASVLVISVVVVAVGFKWMGHSRAFTPERATQRPAWPAYRVSFSSLG
jgi:hypothetical protein